MNTKVINSTLRNTPKENYIKQLDKKLETFTFQVYCHICGKETDEDNVCYGCGQYYCDKCSAPYNQFTQIDYNLCKECYEIKFE